jgi:hypothetical protein
VSHPAIDPDRLAAEGTPPATGSSAGPWGGSAAGSGAPAPPALDATGSLRARARRLAAPMVARARHELARAAADDQAALRAEVAELRGELARVRAEHAAATAALYEELASLAARLDGPPKPSTHE